VKTVVPLLVVVVSLLALVGGDGSGAYAGSGQGCTTCHFTHGAMGPQLIGAATSENLCLSCHSAAGPGPEAAVHNQGPGFTCVDCHNFRYPHGGQVNYAGNTNLAGLRATIDTPANGPLPVRFESRGTDVGDPPEYSFADDSTQGPWDGICEVCHTQTDYHRYNEATTPHYDGRTCTSSRCHLHSTGFADPHDSGLPCRTCHQMHGGR